jgi:chromosome segregation ATPase
MSKGIKQSLFLLIFLLIGSLIFAGVSLIEKQEITEQKEDLEAQLQQTENKVLEAESKIQGLRGDLEALRDEKASLEDKKDEVEQQVVTAQQEIDDLLGRMEQIRSEKSKWKSRFDNISAERDELVEQLQKASEPKVVYKEKIVYKEKEEDGTEDKQGGAKDGAKQESQRDTVPSDDEDEYWAEVLREKAELEIEVNQLKKELTDNSLEIISLKQENADLKIELDDIQRDRELVDKDIQDIKEKYEMELSAVKQDLQKVKETKGALINNLSLELARTKNDIKYVQNYNDKVTSENKELRKQLQQLVSTKGELEKTVVKLKQDKVQIEKKLEQREGMIQAKIQEIWQIKENLDETFNATQLIQEKGKDGSAQDGVDLQPIRVVSGDEKSEPAPQKVSAGYNGKVISVNQENNFVIVDIGEQEGLTLGETLGVYRDAEHVATLEVIQIRQDISAADVKEMNKNILQGDTVR